MYTKYKRLFLENMHDDIVFRPAMWINANDDGCNFEGGCDVQLQDKWIVGVYRSRGC